MDGVKIIANLLMLFTEAVTNIRDVVTNDV